MMTPIAWLAGAWHSHNQRFFDGRLSLPVLKIEYLPNPCEAMCAIPTHAPDEIWLYIHLSFFEQKIFLRNHVLDVLLHEMVHQKLLAEAIEHDHDSDEWLAELKRITPLLGLPQTTFSRLERETWPHGITAVSFYRHTSKRLPGRTAIGNSLERPTPAQEAQIMKRLNKEWDEDRR